MNFTFKTEHPTGRYRSFDHDTHDIKHNKQVVGEIVHGAPFTIRLMVEKSKEELKTKPNCSWRWIKVKKEFASLDEAKQWLKTNHDQIIKQVKLHHIEE